MENDIERDGQHKLYVQIYGIIRRMIEEGEWLPSSIIPSEDELVRMFAVSKTTVRLALSDLARDGYLSRHQGKGTFVKCPLPASGIMMKTRFSDGMMGNAIRVTRESLESGIVSPEPEIWGYLDYEGLIFFSRCRISEYDEPVCIEELFVPLVYFPGIQGENICSTSFFGLIRERSLRKLSRIVQTIEVARLNVVTAKLLKVDEGHPALLMHRAFLNAEGKSVAYIRLYGSCEKYRVVEEFERIR
ncbi:MAG: GntR family transcriptional regulator [Dissulfurispiraceae bacterium]